MTALLEFDDVRLNYGDLEILSHVTLSLDAGETVAVLGPSGSGKTSLVRIALGLTAPLAGRVRINGQTVSDSGKIAVPPECRGLGVVFQDLALWPHLTVHGNLAFALESWGVPKDERESRSADILRSVGLAGKERRYPAALSGGERQRVAIARALVLEPHAILLDEPLSNLDVPLKRELLDLFRDLFEKRKSTVIYVTHDLREAMALCDRIAVIENGRIVQDGTLASMRTQPASAFIRKLVEDLGSNHLTPGAA